MGDSETKSGPKSPRPQSMMAKNFAMDLDSVFGLGDGEGAAKLQENVEEKKKAVSNHNKELEALQARLRAMEERLEDMKPGAASKSVRPVAKEEAKPGKKEAEVDSDEDGEDTDEEEDEEQDESSDDTSAEENPKRKK